jgi:hypothetical protein
MDVFTTHLNDCENSLRGPKVNWTKGILRLRDRFAKQSPRSG